MNIKKGIITGAMALLIGASTLSNVYAESDTKVDSGIIVLDTEWNFKNFSESFKKDISKVDYKKAQELFDKATKFDKDASTYWDQLFALDVFEKFETEEMALPEISFKEFQKEFKKDVKAEDVKKAENLFNKAIELEKTEKYDDASKVWDQLYALNLFEESLECTIVDDPLSFEEFAKEFKKDVKPEELKKAEALFKKVTELEKVEKYDEAMKQWEAFDKLDLYEEIAPYTFKEFAEEFKKDVKADVLKKAEELFKKAMELEKAEKYDEAMKVWNNLYELDLFDEGNFTVCEGDSEELLCQIDEIEYKQPTFAEFSKDFKKNVKPEILTKAKELYEKAVKAEDNAQKVWEELLNMDIYDYDLYYSEEVKTQK